MPELQFNYLFTLKNAPSSSNSYNLWMQQNIAMKFAGYVAWILLYKCCKFREKIYYNSRDIEFFLGDYFFWRALYICVSSTSIMKQYWCNSSPAVQSMASVLTNHQEKCTVSDITVWSTCSLQWPAVAGVLCRPAGLAADVALWDEELTYTSNNNHTSII